MTIKAGDFYVSADGMWARIASDGQRLRFNWLEGMPAQHCDDWPVWVNKEDTRFLMQAGDVFGWRLAKKKEGVR